MCVLSGPEIKKRASDIFSDRWHEDYIQEATYDLRVDTKPLLRIGGKPYDPTEPYLHSHIKIEPGELAMLPTVESFQMPSDLVGSIKIKLSHSSQGLTPLFGPKVDPLFGREHNGERMYLWVSNLGLKTIHIKRKDPVFTVQFHKLYGDAPQPITKEPICRRVDKQIHEMDAEQYLGFMDKIRVQISDQFEDKFTELDHRLTGFERGTYQVVQFGVFLVASALLAGAIAAMFAMIFSLHTESGLTMVETLEGSSLGTMLFWVGIGLSVAVALLAAGALAQFIRSVWGGQGKSDKSKLPSKKKSKR